MLCERRVAWRQGYAVSSDEQGSQDRVFADAGGWISGPSLDAGRLGGPRFGIKVGAWMTEYGARYVLQGGLDGFGFVCWRRGGDGCGVWPVSLSAAIRICPLAATKKTP